MIYHAKNLTHCVVVIPTLPKMRVFLADRQRSVTAKMRRAIKAGLRAGHPEADALVEEMTLILSLQDSLFGD